MASVFDQIRGSLGQNFQNAGVNLSHPQLFIDNLTAPARSILGIPEPRRVIDSPPNPLVFTGQDIPKGTPLRGTSGALKNFFQFNYSPIQYPGFQQLRPTWAIPQNSPPDNYSRNIGFFNFPTLSQTIGYGRN